MENEYIFEKEIDNNLNFEINQFVKIIIHSILFGSIITFIIGVLLYLT